MIYITNSVRARVWNIDRKEKFTDLQLTTTEKKQDGSYGNSHWFARAIGHAHNSLKECKEKDVIVVTKSKITNESYTDKNGQTKSALRWLLFEIELGDNSIFPDKETNDESKQGFIPFQPKPSKQAKPAKETKNVEEADPWSTELPF